jgi:adenine-specific DNA-methyltransferase
MAKKDYQNWSKEKLLHEYKELLKRKKFGLVWDDKPEDVAEQCKEFLPVLKEEKNNEILITKNGLNHIFIEGDNYHALSVLNYTHKKKIDFIYIDPPYNTGAKDWKYNNSYVDEHDPYRHSKWLAFMHKRLRFAKNLLKDTGIICVTIDDNEMPRLWCLMDEVFGEKNHLGTVVIRNNPGGRKTARKVALVHEYALFFGKSNAAKIQKIEILPEEKTHSYIRDDAGLYYENRNLRKDGVDSLAINKKGQLSDRYYPIYYDPKTNKVSTKEKFPVKIFPTDSNGEKRIWRRSKDVIDGMFERGDIWYKKTKYGDQIYFKFRGGLDGEPPESIWYDSKFSASEHGTQVLDRILGKRELFQYPKSHYAVIECIRAATTDKNATILDFFGGSGTTGHAVLQMNEDDTGNRQFILCTNNEDNNSTGTKIAEDICYPRLKKVMTGYSNNGEKVTGLGGNLKYYKTDFVLKVKTDNDKRIFTTRSTEMLCLAEATFEEVASKKGLFAIYENQEQMTGIIFDEDAITDFKKEAKKHKKPFVVYVFSYDHTYNEEDFENMNNLKIVKPIPEVILNVYRKIYKELYKPRNL